MLNATTFIYTGIYTCTCMLHARSLHACGIQLMPLNTCTCITERRENVFMVR